MVWEPWMTGGIVNLVKKRKETFVRFRKLKSMGHLKNINEAEENLNRESGGLKGAMKGI